MSSVADASVPTPLSHRVGRDASAGQVAAAMSAILLEIDFVLVPIIGARGFSALFRRSVHLACASHGWLIDDGDSPSGLVAALAASGDADAVERAEAWLREFHDLLVDLIGPSLTQRLLMAVWGAGAMHPPSEVHQ